MRWLPIAGIARRSALTLTFVGAIAAHFACKRDEGPLTHFSTRPDRPALSASVSTSPAVSTPSYDPEVELVRNDTNVRQALRTDGCEIKETVVLRPRHAIVHRYECNRMASTLEDGPVEWTLEGVRIVGGAPENIFDIHGTSLEIKSLQPNKSGKPVKKSLSLDSLIDFRRDNAPTFVVRVTNCDVPLRRICPIRDVGYRLVGHRFETDLLPGRFGDAQLASDGVVDIPIAIHVTRLGTCPAGQCAGKAGTLEMADFVAFGVQVDGLVRWDRDAFRTLEIHRAAFRGLYDEALKGRAPNVGPLSAASGVDDLGRSSRGESASALRPHNFERCPMATLEIAVRTLVYGRVLHLSAVELLKQANERMGGLRLEGCADAYGVHGVPISDWDSVKSEVMRSTSLGYLLPN